MLDERRNETALLFRDGLLDLARMIEADLSLFTEIDARRQAEAKLQNVLERLENRAAKRTTELQEANAALRVLLSNMTTARDEYDHRVLSQLKGLVLPVLEQLRGRLYEDPTARAYAEMLEENLMAVTASMSGSLTTVFKALTPAEQEVAQMIMRGQSTKDIARTLSREPGTIDFHRNNIRKKPGLRNSGQNLRTTLLSIN